MTWTFLSEHAQVLDYDGRRLLLGISTIGLANTFRKGQHAELVRQALIEVLGVDAVVEGIPTPGVRDGRTAATPRRPSRHRRRQPEPRRRGRSAGGPSSPDREGLRVMAAASPAPDDLGPEPDDDWSAPSAPPPEWATDRASRGPPAAGPARRRPGPARPSARRAAPPDPPAPHPHGAAPTPSGRHGQARPEPEPSSGAKPPAGPRARWSARGRPSRVRRAPVVRASPVAADDSSVSADDEDIEDAGAMGVPVIERVLGGTVMGELDQ